MTVSVVIPVYNEEKYIGKCLKSLINQDEKADEIIVVDNNCTDKSIEICKKFPVIIVTEQKQGIISARNKGFNLAKYEIIARCDADTIVPKDWIKRIKQNFKKKDIIALSGPVFFYDLPLKTTFFSNGYSLATKRIYKNNILMGSNMALKKSAWNKVKGKAGIKDSDVHEDVDMSMILSEEGEIGFDKKLIMPTSGRRIKRRPHTFFVQYPYRMVKTYVRHSKNS